MLQQLVLFSSFVTERKKSEEEYDKFIEVELE